MKVSHIQMKNFELETEKMTKLHYIRNYISNVCFKLFKVPNDSITTTSASNICPSSE